MLELSWPQGVTLQLEEEREALAHKLALQTAEWLRAALQEKDRALLVISGGRTPVAFFKLLAQQELPWSKVDITLADERWVDETHDDSNAALVKEFLLQGPAAEANFLPLKNAAATPEEGCEQLEASLAELSWPIDVLILGMGADGHTASLFPGAKELAHGLDTTDKCAPMHPVTALHPRMTLSYKVLAAARHQALHITGEDKLTTLNKVLARLDAVAEMPVRGFIRPGLNVFWSP
ncbi:6-phosphogluconolactonase [Hahella sp. KA22]|uniref:6-phosphogluconolactonase n=1 Tax=Hahella sp. KA22 TaxID=1628392 RepID=UPI000FDE9954|nr:6-phosphogluconolactonase [Hahella sp. KA22]AZZ89944.1 6-phosphogluconolactonase [Hahella sp. KA22]QAY53313.1 6-phosphogluconolactonase [Hahella sp. KA22]